MIIIIIINTAIWLWKHFIFIHSGTYTVFWILCKSRDYYSRSHDASGHKMRWVTVRCSVFCVCSLDIHSHKVYLSKYLFQVVSSFFCLWNRLFSHFMKMLSSLFENKLLNENRRRKSLQLATWVLNLNHQIFFC